MKTISRGFPPLTIIFISILLISILIPPSALAADVVDSGFVGYTNRPTALSNNSTVQSKHTQGMPCNVIFFKDIVQYGDSITHVTVKIPYANCKFFANDDSGYNDNVSIHCGPGETSHPENYPIVGTAIAYYSNASASEVYFITYQIKTLDLTGYSGTKILYFHDFPIAGLGVWGSTIYDAPAGVEAGWFGAGGSGPSITSRPFWAGVTTYLHTSMSFQNGYYAYDNYALNINKTIGGTPYYSKIKVMDGSYGEILNESNSTTNDIWVLIQDSTNGTIIHYEDSLGDTYTSYPSFTPLPPPDDGVLNTLSGTIINAKTNAVIPSNDVNISTVTGYGGSYFTTSLGDGTYSISRIIDDIYLIEANRTGYEDYEYQKNITKDTPHIIYMTESITLDTNKSGVYGTITNYYNSVGVSDTWVKISNATWSSVTYTNQNGYYEFLNFSPGNYTIQAQKTGYFPYESSLTFIPNVLKYYPIELISEEVPADPTATPEPPVTNILTPFNSLIQQFGISTEFGGAIIALFIIVFMGAIFTRAGPIAMIAAMFFGFIVTVFMGLIPSYLLSIVIIVVVLLILYSRGDS